MTVDALLQLAFLDGGPVADPSHYQPTAGPPVFGEVAFGSTRQGATKWIWDFGDGGAGTCPAGFTKAGATCVTSDPTKGPAPTYQYLERRAPSTSP